MLHRVGPNNRSRKDISYSSILPTEKYTYDLPAPPTQEEVVQEAARALGDSLRTLATNNPTYTHLSNFSGLQQMSDIINSAAKKASDRKSQESQRVTPPNIPGGHRVGTNIIEDDSAAKIWATASESW